MAWCNMSRHMLTHLVEIRHIRIDLWRLLYSASQLMPKEKNKSSIKLTKEHFDSRAKIQARTAIHAKRQANLRSNRVGHLAIELFRPRQACKCTAPRMGPTWPPRPSLSLSLLPHSQARSISPPCPSSCIVRWIFRNQSKARPPSDSLTPLTAGLAAH